MNQTMDLATFTDRFIAEAKLLLHPEQKNDFDEALKQSAKAYYTEPCDPGASPEQCAQNEIYEWQTC